MRMQGDDAQQRVLEQYDAAVDPYARSVEYATASDLERIVELVAPNREDTLLDVATGGGHVVRALAPHVGTAMAIDQTAEILEHAEAYLSRLGIQNVRYVVADADALPFEDGAFSMVTCRIAPHHFSHPERFVAEVARVLRPGGRFALVDSTVDDGEMAEVFNRFEKLRDPSHVRSLTVGEWSSLLEQAGLVVETTERFQKRHEFEDWVGRAHVTPEVRGQLEAMIQSASETVQTQMQATWDVNGFLLAFTDTKTLFLARRGT